VRGVVLAVTSALTQALGSVWAKEGIAPGDDPFSATFIRVLGALAGFAVLITVAGRWRPVLAAARHGRAMRTMVAGAIVGPFAGVVFYMAAMQRCPAGVVTTMVATMPIFILVPAAFLYHERIGYRAIGGAVVSLIGVALLSM
jgi:drug/metabolite transporter (DMT)-like permease